MADMEARREARRRKILQSTDDRMNKVLGRHNENISPTDTEVINSEDILKGPNTDAVEPSSHLRQRNKVYTNIDTNESNSTESPSTKSTVKISPLKRPQTLQNQTDQNESLNSSKSSSESKMMLKHFEFLRIVLCFMTAFLCRKVLVSGYGVFYVQVFLSLYFDDTMSSATDVLKQEKFEQGQSVMLPFMCLEAGFFMFKKKMLHNVILPHRSSMLIGVLMLCGIKPGVLQLYNKTMGYITAASEDFAMFFFAFMFANVFVS